MDEQPTCGKGLAENAALPRKLAELIGAVAAVLEAHAKALDLTDPNSKREGEVYLELVTEHQKAAAQLNAIASRMAGSRELPMGKHDERVMGGPDAQAAFERFVKLEQELLTLLQSRLEPDRQTLGLMSQAGSSR